MALSVALVPANGAQAHDDLAMVFAACAGRYSAELEHAWLMNTPQAEELASTRADLLALLEAVMTPETARDALNYRIEAKIAQSALLTTAEFGTNPERTKAAKRLAERHLKGCKRLLLSV